MMENNKVCQHINRVIIYEPPHHQSGVHEERCLDCGEVFWYDTSD